MELTQLLNSVSTIQLIGEVQRKDVSGIFYDSRRVRANSIFVAIKGFNIDGHKFIVDAINKGAIAVVVEDLDAVPEEIFMHTLTARIYVRDARIALAELSNALYSEPTKKLQLIGITGTNGKTTSTYYVKSILEQANLKCGLVGTISNMIGDEMYESSMTTPESSDLNALFYEMLQKGCKAAVMEASSHSLFLKRTSNLTYRAAIFTNLTQDHLDFHKDFESYFSAKKILFDQLDENAVAVYNNDDPYGKRMVADTKAKSFSFGISEDSDFTITNLKYDLDGNKFGIKHNGKIYEIASKLIGEFNAYNAAGAFAAAFALGYAPQTIIDGINNCKQVPGRFEVIGDNKKVIIDYSHTPDSLEKCISAVRAIVGKTKKIVTVFGCGGNRDKTKRPIMGNIAVKLSDKVFVTSDNPRFEDPSAIIEDVVKGLDKSKYTIEADRREAIRQAINTSDDDSIIILAGKGHEDYQVIGDVKHHLSDKETAEEFLYEK